MNFATEAARQRTAKKENAFNLKKIANFKKECYNNDREEKR